MTLSIAPTWPLGTVLRWVFGIFFVAVGIVHLIVPDGLPRPVEWMYDLSRPMHLTAGTAEILGGLGLILPRLLGVAPRLTIAAAAGLSLLMIGAAVWHSTRGEWPQLGANLVTAGLMAYLAVRESRLR